MEEGVVECLSAWVRSAGCWLTSPARWDWLRRTAALGFLRSDKGYYWRFWCSLFRTVFPSEEIRDALFFPPFKCTTLSLCKSPNVHITGCNYYTVAPSARWDSTLLTTKVSNDLGDFCVKKKLQWSVKKDFLSEARPYFNLGKQSSFRASLNLLAECKLF